MSVRTIVYCVALVLAAVGVTWWFSGGGLLAAALTVLALACPVVVLVVMRMQRDVEGDIRAQAKAAKRDAAH